MGNKKNWQPQKLTLTEKVSRQALSPFATIYSLISLVYFINSMFALFHSELQI